MADHDNPDQNANKNKAEGDRSTGNQDDVSNAARDEDPQRQYEGSDTGDAGGITNRPLSEEIDNQEALPQRGTNRDESANSGSRGREGDNDEGSER